MLSKFLLSIDAQKKFLKCKSENMLKMAGLAAWITKLYWSFPVAPPMFKSVRLNSESVKDFDFRLHLNSKKEHWSNLQLSHKLLNVSVNDIML